MARVLLLVVTILIQLVVGEDLHWVPNSNWDNPGNWKFERPPCSGEVADFASVPENSLIYLNTDATVRSIVLPTNGKIILGSSVTIHFSEEVACTDDKNLGPDVSRVNTFTGAVPHYWECPENWLTEDNFPAARAPCGTDQAVFDEGAAYSFVSSNQSIGVSSLSVRGVPIQSLKALTDPNAEFRLNLTIGVETVCSPPPSGCIPDNPPTVDRPTDKPTDKPPTDKPPTENPSTNVEGVGSNDSKDNSTGVAVGVVVALLVVIVLVVILVVVAIILYMRRKRTGSYTKDDLLEPGPEEVAPQSSEQHAFDNPMYDSATLDADDLNLIGHEIVGVPEKSKDGPGGGPGETAGDGFRHVLNDYEPVNF